MHSYTAFGLDIGSTFPLPELLPGRGKVEVDVAIREDVTAAAPPHSEADEATVAPQEARLLFKDLGACVVRSGREVVVGRLPGSHESDLRLALLGPVMAVLLQQRGFLVLHASVVNIRGRAVAFLGESGRGKSTMAATLQLRGHHLVADDLAAVQLCDDGPRVYAGFPQCKLWPDAVAALGKDSDTLPRLHPGHEKRAWRLAEGFTAEQSLPLSRVFELTVGDAVAIAPMSPREALLALVRHTYGIEWLHPTSGAAQLAARAEVVRRVRPARLSRPDDLTVVAAVAATVEADLEAAE